MTKLVYELLNTTAGGHIARTARFQNRSLRTMMRGRRLNWLPKNSRHPAKPPTFLTKTAKVVGMMKKAAGTDRPETDVKG